MAGSCDLWGYRSDQYPVFTALLSTWTWINIDRVYSLQHNTLTPNFSTNQSQRWSSVTNPKTESSAKSSNYADKQSQQMVANYKTLCWLWSWHHRYCKGFRVWLLFLDSLKVLNCPFVYNYSDTSNFCWVMPRCKKSSFVEQVDLW